MDILIVDPDLSEQNKLTQILFELHSTARIHSFADPLLATKYGANNRVDALYTVPRMRRLNGFELGKLLRSLQPDMELHFIADDESGRQDAMRIMADSYTLRPVTAEALSRAEDAEW